MRLQGTSRSSSGRAGTTAVEFAVVIPIFLAFLIGMLEVGRSYMVALLLTNSARSACRQGILQNQSTATITSKVNSILSSQSITGATTSVTVNGNTVDASTAVSGDDLAVSISVPSSNVTWLPGGQFVFGNLTGQFSLRKE